jgi:uncharacterized protein YidB (DUF937 family)
MAHQIAISPDEYNTLANIAGSLGLTPTELVSKWIAQLPTNQVVDSATPQSSESEQRSVQDRSVSEWLMIYNVNEYR